MTSDPDCESDSDIEGSIQVRKSEKTKTSNIKAFKPLHEYTFQADQKKEIQKEKVMVKCKALQNKKMTLKVVLLTTEYY